MAEDSTSEASTARQPGPRTLPDALRVIYIVDREAARDWQRLDTVLATGATCLWLRAPGATGAELYRSARDLVWRAHERGAAVLIGDRADVALASGADGVQLGFRSPPARKVRSWFPGWIGVSCHSEAELSSAARAGADFAVLSPLFGVPSKGGPLGTALFERLAAGVEIPVVALGGIDETNAVRAREAGAAGVAVIRALRDADDPGQAGRGLGQALSS
ncbi:MAG: thiamine phosphate synthase [Planctomycetota bacterium]|nr:thiamine phosphate synthase [Planctomycetota bacterium]